MGFLGAAAPAVEGLKDAEFSTMPEAMCYEFSDTDFPRFPEPMELPIRQLQETLERLQQLESKLSSLTLMPAPPVKDPALPDPALQFCTMAEHKAAAGFLTPAQKQLLIAVATGTGAEGEAQTFTRSETLTLLTRFVDLLPRQISAERFPAVRQQKSPVTSGAIEQLRKIFAAQSGIV